VELRTLSYFVAIAEAGTVIAASENVRIAQPAMSRQLRQLERELGVDLFDRQHGRLTLSSAGRALLPLAHDVLKSAQDFRRAAEVRALGRMTTVGIAAPTTTLTDLVSPFIATLDAEDPTPSVLVSDGLTPENAVAAGADMVIAPHLFGPAFSTVHVATLPVFAYVRTDHRWAAQSAVGLEALCAEEVIVLPRLFGARHAVDAALAAAQLPPLLISAEANNGTVAQALAAGGRGVALVSDDPRYDLVPLHIMTPGDAGPVVIDLYAGWPTSHPGAALLRSLADRLTRWTSQQYQQA
jgi:DNA-binding transcriptional LysR family regulator